MNLLTRRFPTILGLLLLIAGAFGGWWYITNNKPKVAVGLIPDKVRITNVADNKFTVSWTTTTTAAGYIEYGAVGEKLSTLAYDDRDAGGAAGSYLTHHVTVSELQPETQYAFRILSGTKNTRFDNNGSPYPVTTGPTIAVTPTAKSFYGEVASETGQAVAGAIVYLGLPGAAPASTLVTSSANYTFALSTVRTADLSQYVEYDPTATVANVTVESGRQESVVTVTTANSAPVPKILLGQNADYRTLEAPAVAQVTPEASDSGAVTPGIFNVEPLSGSEERTSTSNEVVLLNPEEEGEQVATSKPEFRGTGPDAKVLSITVQSAQPYSGTVVVANDGTWSWTPPADLAPGEHTVTIAYIDEAGTEQSLVRRFFVSSALAAEGDPAITATPSASVKASPTASVRASASPVASGSAVRETIPSTESGVPVTGVLSPTLLTGALGLVIMVLGALMLAL